jgi:hypothetical protein
LIGAIVLGVLLLRLPGGPLHPARAASPSPATSSSPHPPQAVVDPGTYAAGTLKAPASLGRKPLEPPHTQEDAAALQKARDALSRAADGAPAIAAEYASRADVYPIDLQAARGFTDPGTYVGGGSSSSARYRTIGTVHCAMPTGVALTVCIRTSRAPGLTVVVVAPSAKPAVVTSLVNEAWTDLGGQ